MFKNRKKIKELEAKLNSCETDLTAARETIDRMTDMYNSQLSQYKAKLSNKDQTIDELTNKISEMDQRELFYKKHYKLDEEPNEETIVQIRTDLKVHELEMVVMKYEVAEKNRMMYEKERLRKSIQQHSIMVSNLNRYLSFYC